MATREVDYESIDISSNAAGLAALQALGLSTVPIVTVGEEHATGARLDHVADLLGIVHDDTPLLAPEALIERLIIVLKTSMRLTSQIPPERLGDGLPHRDRSYLGLANHLIEIAVGFVEVTLGARLSGRRAAAVPLVELNVESLATRCDDIVQSIELLLTSPRKRWDGTVETYAGDQDLHQVLERTTWHCAQHARQLAMVLEILGIEPDEPLAPDTFVGLPMPTEVWDG